MCSLKKVSLETMFFMRIIVTYHLNRANELFLLHINVRDVQPDIAKLRCRLAHLSKYISSLVHATFVREHRADTVRSPNILRIVSQNLVL